jgi:hypothetical protein
MLRRVRPLDDIVIGAEHGVRMPRLEPAKRQPLAETAVPTDLGSDGDCVVYLDLDFASHKYEGKFETDPQAKITKQRGGSARMSAYFANVDVSTREYRTYSITSRQHASCSVDAARNRLS